MDNKELNEEKLLDIHGGLSSVDLAISEGEKSKFKEVREMAEKAKAKMPKNEEKKELNEAELQEMAYNYYHGDEEAYKK